MPQLLQTHNKVVTISGEEGAVTGKAKNVNTREPPLGSRPALDPQARENQLVAKAVDLAEQQLANGTASSQVITHYLKLASPSEKKKAELLDKQVQLIDAKIDALKSSAKIEELYAGAMKAMRSYGGQDEPDD